MSVRYKLYMARPPKNFRFFFFFSVFPLPGYSVGFFSPSLIWAFGCTSFYHHPDILCCLVHTQGFPDSFTLLA